jgi:glycosyltransferase involved in cell wall biosynthesis
MRILQIHKYYWPRDGASKYMLQLSALLEQAGHTVIPFSMENEQNLDSPYKSFFVSGMDLSDPRTLSSSQKRSYALRMLFSREAKSNLSRLLEKERIDVAHIHNIYHHISPSILGVLKKHKIPIVMTLHDYKLLSPNYSLFHHGQIHEEDAKGWYGSCVRNKCVKGNKMYSRLARLEMIFHHKIGRFYERHIDRFIAPSRFMHEICVRHGWPAEKFAHIVHPVETPNKPSISDGYSAIYLGRLSEEKGVDVLVRAATHMPDIPIRIVGDGPKHDNLRSTIKKLKVKNVTLTGFKTGATLQAEIDRARVLVMPSIWYENYPLSVLEAKAAGKIVIASHIGGLPELVPKPLLVPPGDPKTLAQTLRLWYGKPLPQRQKMGHSLQNEVRSINDPGKHTRAIERLYSSLGE